MKGYLSLHTRIIFACKSLHLKKERNTGGGMIALYDSLIATIPGLERKGATMPYTSVNGHMFSFLDKEGRAGLRLPKEALANFLKKYKTTLCEAHGAILKEYALVPEKLMSRTKELQPYFLESYEYVKSLKPKPAKKKSK